ncbi:YceI family protein [Flammeovirga pacifica]|uniref:Lipid/polyisoprenoid-binding YceI-like domain-containing protein n=1 Tax=Flammeovirga pacifica TaxID=915059 RepID=A0A1S1YXH7_FLAPC|nr:YceI family protein [Flammeovirga pacifica]OHX65719.1 hypothetical protein NH26_04815 [Flammeovirga pacifica]
MKYTLLFLSVLLCNLTTYSQNVNSSKSKVEFEISNFRVNTVEGFFNEMTGNVIFDEDDLSSSKFDVCISTSTVNTGNEKRDDHLKNEDFFDVEKYPKICFISNEIIKDGDKFIAKGKLMAHGVTKNTNIYFIKNSDSLSGEMKINRLDFDIGKDTGTFTVGDEVNIKIFCFLNNE